MTTLRDRVLAMVPVAIGLSYWFFIYVPNVSPAGERDMLGVDLYAYFVPGFLHIQQRLSAGEIPLWNPYEGFGTPLLGALQLQVFYPPRLLFFSLLPLGAALQAYICFHVALAGVASYALARERGRDPFAAALGGVVCAASLQFAAAPSQLPWTASLGWLPLVVLMVERVFFRPTTGAVVGLGLAAAMEILAGYAEIPLAAGLAIVVCLLVSSVLRLASRDGRGVLVGSMALALGGALALGLTAFQVLPFNEMVRQSWRTAAGVVEPLKGYFFPQLNVTSPLPGALMTQFFVGGPPLALLVLGTLRVERNRLPLGIAAFACFAAGSFLFPFVHTLPLFAMSRGGAAWAIAFAAFAPAVVADGLDWVWAGRARRPVRLVLVLAIGAAVLWYARPPLTHGPKGIEGIRTMAATRTYLVAALVATVVGALVRHPAARTAAGAVLVATTLADLWGLTPTRNPPLVPSGILNPSRRRMLAERMAADPDRPRTLAPIVTELGGNVLQRVDAITAYPTFLLPARTTALFEHLQLSGASIAPIQWRRLAAARGIVNAMGLRFALVLPGDVPASAPLEFRPVQSNHGVTVLQRASGGVRRAELVHCATIADGAEAAFAAVLAPSFNARRCAVVEEPVGPLADPPPGVTEEVRLARYREEDVVVDVRAAAPALLVLADAFYPGWQVTVDGVRRPLLRANYLFRGVGVDAGEHEVRFRYRPWSFIGGAIVTAGAIFLLAVMGGRRLTRRRRPRSTP
jgi:Bacterial membrane protein YfhO